jgi:hypothetical protein
VVALDLAGTMHEGEGAAGGNRSKSCGTRCFSLQERSLRACGGTREVAGKGRSKWGCRARRREVARGEHGGGK